MPHSLSPSEVPERPTNISVIEACSVLNAMSDSDRQELAGGSFMAYAERGEAIWLAGSPSVFFGVVGNGFVKIAKTTPSGADVAIELTGPGECFGLMAALDGRPFPLAAIAVCNTWYLKVPTQIIRPVYERSADLKDQIIRAIGPRLRRAQERMGRLSSGRVEERIAEVLLLLFEGYGTPTDHGVELSVPLTRQDIAEMAGTTVETTIRTMSRWQRDGVVTTDCRRLTLHDEAALSTLALK